MSALVQNLGDFLKLVIQAFNFSSSFPSGVFVTLVYLYLLPLLSPTSPLRIDLIEDPFLRGGLLLVQVALIAYFLDAANLPLIRLFEGYPIRGQYPFNRWEHRNRAFVKYTVDKLRELEKIIGRLTAQAEHDEHWEKLLNLAEKLDDHRDRLSSQIAYRFPEETRFVLPTAIGNIVSAAECYPSKVFGMDAVTLWPFLSPILTREQFAPFVLREKAMMDFFLNLTVMLGGFGLLFGLGAWWVEGWSLELIVVLLLVGIASATTFGLSLYAAANWGTTIRAAFVLFREQLRQILRLRQPHYYEDERQLWQTASNFLRAKKAPETQLAWGRDIFDQSSYLSQSGGSS